MHLIQSTEGIPITQSNHIGPHCVFIHQPSLEERNTGTFMLPLQRQYLPVRAAELRKFFQNLVCLRTFSVKNCWKKSQRAAVRDTRHEHWTNNCVLNVVNIYLVSSSSPYMQTGAVNFLITKINSRPQPGTNIDKPVHSCTTKVSKQQNQISYCHRHQSTVLAGHVLVQSTDSKNYLRTQYQRCWCGIMTNLML